MQVVRGSLPKSVPSPRASKDGKPQQQPSVFNDPTAGLLSPAAPQWSSGAATGTEDRDPGAAPRREGKCDTRASRHSERLKARQQAAPLSPQDNFAQCESFLERARKREAAARELVLQAQTELTRLSAEVVEGEQRLATLRAELERGTVVEGEGNRPEPQAGLSSGRLHPTMQRGDARVDRGRTEGSSSGHCGQAAPRSREGLPTLVHKQSKKKQMRWLSQCHMQNFKSCQHIRDVSYCLVRRPYTPHS